MPQQRVLRWIWFLLQFFPSVGTAKVVFGKAGAAVLGVVFPLGVYMSVHPIPSSPDVHRGWEGGSESQGP